MNPSTRTQVTARRLAFKLDRKSTRLNSSHSQISYYLFFFLKNPAPTEIYPLPLHDALPILLRGMNFGMHESLDEDASYRASPSVQVRSEEHTSELQSQSNLVLPFFFFKEPGPHRDLPSSPPRRSSDLVARHELRHA